MGYITDLPLFLASTALISVPLVVSPGPVFAVTVAKGAQNKMAGALIALGHGAVEFPLILLLYLGLSELIKNSIVHKVIGIIGGLIMIYLGFQILKSRKEAAYAHSRSERSSFVAGLVATGANPYFFISWATIGAVLVENAAIFGLFGILLFSVVHWLIDLVWDSLVSLTVFKSRRFWTPKVFSTIFVFCFIILVSFGLWFIIISFF